MKKLKLLILLGMIMVAAIAYHVRNANSHFSDMELENIEALADGENPSEQTSCFGEGGVECPKGGYVKYTYYNLKN